MNAVEHFICSSSLWRHLTQRHLLPWVLSDMRLGDHVLEIGAGYGPATSLLRKSVARVTSLEYNHNATVKLKSLDNGRRGEALTGDGSQLPFPADTFSSVIAVLVLHHMKTRELQDQMMAEVFRVLRPGGIFVTFEVTDSWIHRVGHFRSTFTPISPGSAFARLTAAGFSRISVDFRGGGFRLSATRAQEEKLSAAASA